MVGRPASARRAFQIEYDAFEIGLIDDLFALRCAEEEGAVTDIVDAAGLEAQRLTPLV